MFFIKFLYLNTKPSSPFHFLYEFLESSHLIGSSSRNHTSILKTVLSPSMRASLIYMRVLVGSLDENGDGLRERELVLFDPLVAKDGASHDDRPTCRRTRS